MIRALLLLVLLLIVWLAAGRPVTVFLDRVIPFPASSLPVTPLRYDGALVIGGTPMTLGGIDNLRIPVAFTFDAANRTILDWGRDSFILGPRTSLLDRSGRTDFEFTSEPGDEVSFTRRKSLAGWPTPFDIRFLGGPAPWWKRYTYYRLIWKKRSGARLEILWRYEQQYYSKTGWTNPEMMWNSQTGVLSVKIQVESQGMDGAVVRYIARTKGWPRHDYRIEPRGAASDGRNQIFAVIHRDDECNAVPGAGKSVELFLDPATLQITKEVGGQ